jgi:predicted transcriptional regulator
MAKTGRMEFRVDDSFVAAVNDLAARTHKSKAEVLRDAVNLYYKAVSEWEENGRGIVFQPIGEKPAITATTAEELCWA